MAKVQADNTYLTKEQVAEVWGENFLDLCEDKKIEFLTDKIVVLLDSPVTNNEGELVDVLEIEEPTGSDLRRLDAAKGQTFQTAAILVEVCGNLPVASVNKMKSRQLLRIAKVGFHFLA